MNNKNVWKLLFGLCDNGPTKFTAITSAGKPAVIVPNWAKLVSKNVFLVAQSLQVRHWLCTSMKLHSQ